MTYQRRVQECELRSLNNADGSARFNFGRSSVLTGVYGPREGKASQKDSGESIVVVNFGAKGAVGSQWDRPNEAVMRECLQAMVFRSQNPMCVIDVTVQPMCEDGAQLAASFNAAVAALIDAGVALRFIAVGLCFAISPQDGILLDPTREEVGSMVRAEACNVCPNQCQPACKSACTLRVLLSGLVWNAFTDFHASLPLPRTTHDADD